MAGRAILALDEGTTSTRALVFDASGAVLGSASQEIGQLYPAPGWVEHDPDEIFAATVAAGRAALDRADVDVAEIAGLGITNQRETAVVWERRTGRPIHNAVVWQSRASVAVCDDLKRDGFEPLFRQRTGLVVDAYFSGTKIRWLLDRVDGAQERAERGELLFGTIDSWLTWRLTGGRVHATDVSNASRTLLFNIATGAWDDDLLAALRVPRALLPRVAASSGVFGETDATIFGRPIPIAGIAGDQHAALFGQVCFQPGDAKNTYGTGCFLLTNTGAALHRSDAGLLTTVAWDIGQGTSYALEGSVFVAGAAVQWLRDGLRIIDHAADTERLAGAIADNGGVYLVPAFVGLGAPNWDPHARGLLIGLTQGSGREHLARAALESIAYQSRDIAEAMAQAGAAVRTLKVDGGGTANGFLMQFQADVLGVPITVAAVQETTALGAAYLAGLATGVWSGTAQLATQWRSSREYEPRMGADQRESLYAAWLRAVERSRGWQRP